MAAKYQLRDTNDRVVVESHYRARLEAIGRDATSDNPRTRQRMETAKGRGLRNARKLTLVQIAGGKERKLQTFGG